jgi:heparin binding hemagglutinin HbhA
MARTNSTKSNKVDPTRPFYAAVGGVDVAVAYARTGLTEAQTRLAKVDFEPKALVDGLQKEAKVLPSRVEAFVDVYRAEIGETVDELNKQYVDLAARGRTLVNRIRRQQATQELKGEASKTTSKAKTTATQTKKAASTAKSSAKATGTSAKKTASATKKATQGAAAKTGA